MPIISGLVKPGDQALISISPILKCSAMMILILSKDLYSFVKKGSGMIRILKFSALNTFFQVLTLIYPKTIKKRTCNDCFYIVFRFFLRSKI